MKIHSLYLVGFMGAGKSTIARTLAKQTGWQAEDMDELIESRENRSIASIFTDEGEAYFRRIEQEVLADLLSKTNIIVATGGGTFIDSGNREAILSTASAAWLDLPFNDVIRRIPPDGKRPLANNRIQLEQLYLRRQPSYQEAHIRIDSSQPVSEVVEQLLTWIDF